jgi:flagellar operon protein
MGYRVINGKLHLIEGYKTCDKPKNNEAKNGPTSFKDILDNQINEKESFVISKHAAERLEQRNINFNEADMKNISEGINKAKEKGCRESFIFYKDTALIASIKNRTIITALDKMSSKGNIFTNLDSVIML